MHQLQGQAHASGQGRVDVRRRCRQVGLHPRAIAGKHLPGATTRHRCVGAGSASCRGRYWRRRSSNVWFAFHDIDLKSRASQAPHFFNANDYNLLVQLAQSHQGVVLGWHILVAPLVEKGLLVRPVPQQVVLKDTFHYLSFNEDKEHDSSCRRLRDWLLAQYELLQAP